MTEISWHNLSGREVGKLLKTDIKKGLPEKVVEIRQKELGKNKLPEEKPLSRLKIFLSQFRSPLIYILMIAGTITLVLRELTDTIVIFAAVAVNTAVGFVQEQKASNTLRELKKVLRTKATVLREGKEKQIWQEELVVGDIIILKVGDKVPADGRLIEAWNLQINEASLTGEWLTAEKISQVLPEQTPLADRENMVYMGTIAEDGEGRAVVTAIGSATEIGKVAGLIKKTKEEKTPYQRKLAHFSKIVAGIIAVVCGLIFIEGIATGRAFIEMFVVAVAVAVAAIPEGLPVAMTVILALGMQRILKRRGLVRKLASAETLGSTSIIATDKTLTLTEGRMEVTEIKALNKALALQIAALANEAFVENPKEGLNKWKIRGRPTDRALILAAAQQGLRKPKLDRDFPKIDEIPFNTQNKFIATLHKNLKHPKSPNLLYISGAPEKIMGLSKRDERKRQKLTEELENLTGRGLRVIAVAYKKLAQKPGNKIFEKIRGEFVHIRDLTFVGFIGLRDPLRKEAKLAFRLCQRAGMKPIIVTGDHLLTAKAVAKELGLRVKKENIMLGKDLDDLTDKELQKRLKKINVFARVEPLHKLRIIEAWQAKDQVVAMTGDGVNDAPALKKADIGVALGSGTDVAKDVSDLVLLNDNFSILVAAVEEGRAILDNIRKVITYLLSDSFTEIILIGVSLLFGFPLPIMAVQILWVNIIEDGPLGLCLAFEPKERDLMKQKPQNHALPLLTKEMRVLIFIIGLMTDLLLLGLFFWLLKYSGYETSHIQSVIFAGLTIDSIFYIFSCKSLRKNLWKINLFSNKFLIAAWIFGVIMLLGALYLPPLQTLLKTVPLNIFDWQLILGLGLLNIILIEAAKHYFIMFNLRC